MENSERIGNAQNIKLSEASAYLAWNARATFSVEDRSFNLIEALATSIAETALAATDASTVSGVEVRVRKPEAPIDGDLETVEAALVRHRPDR